MDRLELERLGLFWVVLHEFIASLGVLLVVLAAVGIGCNR
jgi:hypothetical protein